MYFLTRKSIVLAISLTIGMSFFVSGLQTYSDSQIIVDQNNSGDIKLITTLQQLRSSLGQEALTPEKWQALETQWKLVFERPTSITVNRVYNQLQVSYQYYMLNGDTNTFRITLEDAELQLAEEL